MLKQHGIIIDVTNLGDIQGENMNNSEDTTLRTIIFGVVAVFLIGIFFIIFYDANRNINLPKSYKEGFDTSNLSDEASKIVGAWYGEEISQDANEIISGVFNFYSNGTGEIMMSVLNGRSYHTPFTYTYDFKNNKLEIVCKNKTLSYVINNIDDSSLTMTSKTVTTAYVKIDYDYK